MKQQRPPIKEIIRLTGLSRATIDRVLNERSGVHTRTLETVNAALRQLREKNNASSHTHHTDRCKHYKAIIQVGDAFTQSIVDEAARLAPSLAARNCTLEVLPCVGIPSKRVAGLIAAQSDADGLIVIAKNSAEIVDAAALFREQGKAIVTSHTDLDLAARHAYVGIDNRAAGQTVGFLMGRHMPADAPANLAVVVEAMNYRCHEEREMGFRSVLRQRFPAINVIEVVKHGDSAEAGHAAIKSLLETYPKIDGIYNTAGGNQGVAMALAEHGSTGKTLFVTHEYNRVTEALIRRNEVDYLITQNMKHMLLEATDQLNAILSGAPQNTQVLIPLEILCHYSLPLPNANANAD